MSHRRGVWRQAPLYFFHERRIALEGYFRASEYAQLENIDYFTAMQRVHRNKVEFFKEPKTGNVYIYWSDKPTIIPDGFICINDFASKHHVGRETILRCIRENRIRQEDVFYKPVSMRTHVYIREDTNVTFGYNYTKIQQNKPKGYLTLIEWCEKNGVKKATARQMVFYHTINYLRIEKHIYVPENEPAPEYVRNRAPDGYLSLKEWCKKYKYSYDTMYTKAVLGKMPIKRIKKFIFIEDLPKEELMYDYKVGVG